MTGLGSRFTPIIALRQLSTPFSPQSFDSDSGIPFSIVASYSISFAAHCGSPSVFTIPNAPSYPYQFPESRQDL